MRAACELHVRSQQEQVKIRCAQCEWRPGRPPDWGWRLSGERFGESDREREKKESERERERMRKRERER